MAIKLKKCSSCLEDKKIEEFHKDSSKGPDARRSQCRTCVAGKSKTDLSRLLTLPSCTSDKGWSVQEAKTLLKSYVRLRSKGGKLTTTIESCRPEGRGVFATRGMIGELTKAAKEGMSLEEYFEKGRPFKANKPKVLVARK